MLLDQLKKLLLVLYFVVCWICLAVAQSNNIDSLLNLINTTNPDSVNGQIYYNLARNNYASDTKNAIQWAKLGANYFENSKSYALMTRCMNLEAVCLFILDKHEEASKLHYRILKIREEQQDTLGMAESLLNIGNIFYRGKDQEQAAKFYLRSRAYALKSNNTKLLSSLSNNLGNYYKDLFIINKRINDKNAAIKYLKESIYYKEKLKSDKTLENAFATLAIVYFESEEHENALLYAKKAEKYALQFKNPEVLGSSKVLLCKIAIKNKNFELAQSILDELYVYIAKNKAFHILNLLDEDIALLRDKIRNLRTTTSLSLDSTLQENHNALLLSRQKVREELNIKYETEKTELENINLALKNEIAQDKIAKTKIISIITVLFALALLGFLIKLKNKNREIIKSENAIKQQAKQLIEQNSLLKQSEAFKAKLN